VSTPSLPVLVLVLVLDCVLDVELELVIVIVQDVQLVLVLVPVLETERRAARSLAGAQLGGRGSELGEEFQIRLAAQANWPARSTKRSDIFRRGPDLKRRPWFA
jgi:hypothetical protein